MDNQAVNGRKTMSEHRYAIEKLYRMAKKLQFQPAQGLSQVGEIYNASNFTGREKRKAKDNGQK